jgi:hypothetical protein
MYCLVGMHDLRAAPFSLTYDTLVRAKVLARNERGWSAASEANTVGAKVQVEPLAMGATKRGILTGPTQIDVYWDSITTPQDGGSPVLSYHLQYDNGTAATTWYDVVGLAPDSLATSILVSSQLVSGTVYGFRVRARNIFGWGPYSLVTSIKAAREPGTPLAPVTSIDAAAGALAIDWTAPDARGDAITAYLVEIADKAGTTWHTENATCDATQAALVAARRCTVPMTVLTSAKYGYAYSYATGGDLVQVRVKAANFFGFGVLSPVSDASGARIRAVPGQMAAPTEDASCTDVTLTMNWVALSGLSAGSSSVIAYSLYWDAGVAEAVTFTELTDALVTSFTVNAVEGGKTYRFKVRARNIYGYGEYSPVTVVIPDDKPGKTAIATVAVSATTPTEVEVSWPLPNDHSSVIESYEILFMLANGDFAKETTRCDGTLPAVVSARKCSVPMATLRTLTARPRDSLIRVKVRAFNAKGSGAFSEVNTAGATIETEPTNLSVVSIDVPSTSNTATKVVWTALTGSARGGWDVAITNYEVYWDQASGTWASLANTTALETVKTGLVGGTVYQFKVRAYNKYGEGLFTDAVSVNTSQAPDQPAAPTLEVVGAHVKISWVRPFRNHREVTAYQILLATAAGVF